MRIRILRSAFKDLAAGRRFYERQGEGLGDYFLDSLFSDIDSLNLYAGIHRQAFGFHRLLSKRFPFAIYYRCQSEKEAIVFRILDSRRDPARIEAELKKAGP